MAQPAFRDITDFNLNDPAAVIAKVIEEVAPAGVLLEGKILPKDRELATRFIDRLKHLNAEQWAIVVDTAWAEVRKRPDVLAAMLADIPWVEFSTELVEKEELPAAVRTGLSRSQQTRLVTELAQRHMAADVAIEVAIIALLSRQGESEFYESFAEVVPLASLSTQKGETGA